MNKVKQFTAILVGILCLTLPAMAQKGKALGKVLETAVNRKIVQQMATKAPHYDPVLGYNAFFYKVPGSYNSFINTTLKEGHKVGLTTIRTPITSENSPLQVAPITNVQHANKAFKKWSDLFSLEKAEDQITFITQALYLRRLATQQLETRLAQEAETMEKRILRDSDLSEPNPYFVAEVPTLRFLHNLLDPKFEPKSYATLLAETEVYPKHITLNAQGFPVPTAQAKEARILDNYLLLAKKNERLNNSRYKYHTFVLTPEERTAAEKLLALRKKGDILPANPTPRQLLENIYNQMEREVFPYNDPAWKAIDIENTTEYRSLFPFQYTPVGLAIEEVLFQAGGDTAWQQSYDMAHLMIVNAIINPDFVGELFRFSNYDNLQKAFERLWKETPRTPENIAHLKVLQKHVVSISYDMTGEGTEQVLKQAEEIASWE